jgi:hypothetical protein
LPWLPPAMAEDPKPSSSVTARATFAVVDIVILLMTDRYRENTSE